MPQFFPNRQPWRGRNQALAGTNFIPHRTYAETLRQQAGPARTPVGSGPALYPSVPGQPSMWQRAPYSNSPADTVGNYVSQHGSPLSLLGSSATGHFMPLDQIPGGMSGSPSGYAPPSPMGRSHQAADMQRFGLHGTPGMSAGLPGSGTLPGGAPQSPAPAPAPQLRLNTNFAPISVPTRESQNQLHALGIQRANPIDAIGRLMGSSGVRASSGAIANQLIGPMMDAYRQGAQGAASLGIDDQLLRDTHALKGIKDLTMADIEGQRNMAQRDAIGIDARNRTFGSLTDVLRSLFGAFDTGAF